MTGDRSQFAGRKIFITGHTGFVGGWLSVWLACTKGAKVRGFSLPPPTVQSLFKFIGLGKHVDHVIGDVRDFESIKKSIHEFKPDVIFHLAAQPLVRSSYDIPLETLETNVMGTVNLLEAVRNLKRPVAVVIFTSDKCYEIQSVPKKYSETDPLGGSDIYSMSKGAVELVVSGYRQSFFKSEKVQDHGVRLATIRAGNVIGGGDFALDRIIPDCVRALQAGTPIVLRNPSAVRPWQHVLEPISGCDDLMTRLCTETPSTQAKYCESWNCGPDQSEITVQELVQNFLKMWKKKSEIQIKPINDEKHEVLFLGLDVTKAKQRLRWKQVWKIDRTLQNTAAWYESALGDASEQELLKLCEKQIETYMTDLKASR